MIITKVEPRKIYPQNISMSTAIFGINNDMNKYIHKIYELPPEFNPHDTPYHSNPKVDPIIKWAICGLKDAYCEIKKGLDKDQASRHMHAVMRSFAISFERKVCGIAFLIDEWFDDFKFLEFGELPK